MMSIKQQFENLRPLGVCFFLKHHNLQQFVCEMKMIRTEKSLISVSSTETALHEWLLGRPYLKSLVSGGAKNFDYKTRFKQANRKPYYITVAVKVTDAERTHN